MRTDAQKAADCVRQLSMKKRRREKGLCAYCGVTPIAAGLQCDACREKQGRGRRRPTGQESRRLSQARFRQSIRDRIFGAYGGKCACCGETEQEFLQLDHINGGGNREIKELQQKMLDWRLAVIKAGFPADYQLLCANCNISKARNGECVHQRTILALVS